MIDNIIIAVLFFLLFFQNWKLHQLKHKHDTIFLKKLHDLEDAMKRLRGK